MSALNRLAVLALFAITVSSAAFATGSGGKVEQGSTGQQTGYGAIAADERGHMGYAIGFGKRADAERAAFSGCGRQACKIVLSERTACVAYIDARRSDGAYWYWVASGQGADTRVRQWCAKSPEASAAGCKIQIDQCQGR